MNRQIIKREAILGVFFRFIDAVIIIASATISYFIKFGSLGIANQYYFFTITLILLTVNVFSALKVYQGWRGKSFFTELTTITISWLIVILLISSLMFITKTGSEFSREWAAWFFTTTYLVFITYRAITRKIIRHLQESGYNQKEVIIIGAGKLGLRAAHAMQEQSWAGLIPVAFFDDNLKGKSFNNIKTEGTVQEAIDYIERRRKTKPIDQVWIALPLYAQKEIELLQESLLDTATKIYFIPDLFGFNLSNYSVDEMVGLPVMNMSAPPMTGWSEALKRLEDIIAVSYTHLTLPTKA